MALLPIRLLGKHLGDQIKYTMPAPVNDSAAEPVRPGMRIHRVTSLALAWWTVGCADSPPSPSGDPALLPGLQVTGIPESDAGATWIYRATTEGVTYDLAGLLLKPPGPGPFPAVIISHGRGGNAAGYSRNLGKTMVTWGLVSIATNYTHAGGVPVGAPGTASERGASAANVLRARKLLEILASLGYVDLTRVAAHGHSMGAFLTAALVADRPNAFLVASHTAGGVRPDGFSGDAAAPTEAQAMTIRTPYSMHHGDLDTTVPLASDQRLADLLTSLGVAHELVVYPGSGHNDVPTSSAVLGRIRTWYTAHGLF